MSKLRMSEIEEAEEEVLRQDDAKHSPKGGRPKGGNRATAKALGIGEQEIRRTRKHIEIAEQPPVFQSKNWKRSQVITAGEALQSIPTRERVAAVEMVSDPFQYWKAHRAGPT